MFSGPLSHVFWANKRSVRLMMLHVLSSELIRRKRKWRCSTRGSLYLPESCFHSGAACLAVYTDLRKLCTVVLHALASAPIWGSYAQWYCTSWHLHQSEDTMHSGSARIGVCTKNPRVGFCTTQGTVCTVILYVLAFAPIRGRLTQVAAKLRRVFLFVFL